MKRTRRGTFGVVLCSAGALTVAACVGGSPSSPNTSPAGRGGTLTYLNVGPTSHLDPQRVYTGSEIQFGSRVFARTLTTYTPSPDPRLVADLATDTGTTPDGGRTWKFTLKDGVKWQDGRDIACEDVKYGVSRTFATDVITQGPTYALTFLDVPTDASGEPQYKGPYTKVGQELFDRAVTCEGKTVTFRFNRPWADFNQATATLLAFAPFRQDQDRGAQSDFLVFSSGPYVLEPSSAAGPTGGSSPSPAFDPAKGGRFVRNPAWSEATDPVRKAYPDVIEVVNGLQADTIYARLLSDQGNDRSAVAGIQAPPAVLPQIEGSPGAKARSATVQGPYVHYVAPNVRSSAFANEKARQALAVATNREAYATAYGGRQAMEPTYAMCNRNLPCYKDFTPFNAPVAGDPAAARRVLQDAGIPLPVPIRVVYQKRPTPDKALQTLKESWDAAGFAVTLEGITDRYPASVTSPAFADREVFWALWGADWPSGSTVIPPLFDGRSLTAAGSGTNLGYFDDPAVNEGIDRAYAVPDPAAREKAWGDLDETVSRKGAVVPLGNQRLTFLWGSDVRNFSANTFMGSYPDLATVAVR